MNEHDATETAYRNGYADGKPTWIPMAERSPEPKEKAICINRHGEMMIGTYTEWGWMFPCYYENPTHWMPLPPATEDMK